jgi:FHS family L-fucose permease-like MFS transporter
MAIVGGAVLPLIVGYIADYAGLHAGYMVPMLGYACISAFGFAASRVRLAGLNAALPGVGH